MTTTERPDHHERHYFHGFASSSSSAKITMLRPLLEPHGIVLDVPDLNVPLFAELDWNAMVAMALEHARANPPQVLVLQVPSALWWRWRSRALALTHHSC